MPSQGGRGGGAKGLIFDIDPKPGKTFAYKKDPEFPSLGAYGESEDITGGMGLPGVAELDKFVNAGGVLITLGAASYFAPETFIAKTVDAARTTGGLLRARTDCGGRDSAARTSHLLRLYGACGAGPLGRRSAAARACRGDQAQCADALPRQ